MDIISIRMRSYYGIIIDSFYTSLFHFPHRRQLRQSAHPLIFSSLTLNFIDYMLRLFSASSELARTSSIRLAPTTKTERFFKSGSLIPINIR